MSISKFLDDWAKLAQQPASDRSSSLTTEVMYDWSSVNNYFNEHPDLDQEAIIEAIRGGFLPAYPMDIGDGAWQPAPAGPLTLSVSFNFDKSGTVVPPGSSACFDKSCLDKGCGDGVSGD